MSNKTMPETNFSWHACNTHVQKASERIAATVPPTTRSMKRSATTIACTVAAICPLHPKNACTHTRDFEHKGKCDEVATLFLVIRAFI